MKYTAAVITVSDKGAAGLREDTSGPAVCAALEDEGWTIVHRSVIPDELEVIKSELIRCSDELGVCLTVTSGGTGFSKRDITPEATLAVVKRQTPGIPEAMRAESMRITPRGMLSRSAAGIRGETLIVNLPGSKKAALECLGAVAGSLQHGIDMLRGTETECASKGRVLAVCISEKKGEQKHEIDSAYLRPEHGIDGDAHAGNWHRQVSLLGAESVKKVQEKIEFKLNNGDFAENILTEGIILFDLPVGTRMRIGEALAEVTQIGKECHQGCAIREAAGDCVMPREGIFIRILEPGMVKAGDEISILGINL